MFYPTERGYLVPQVLPFKFVQKICMKQGLYGIISVKRGSWRLIIITDKCVAKIFHVKSLRVCFEECCLNIYSVQCDIQFPVKISYFWEEKSLFLPFGYVQSKWGHIISKRRRNHLFNSSILHSRNSQLL